MFCTKKYSYSKKYDFNMKYIWNVTSNKQMARSMTSFRFMDLPVQLLGLELFSILNYALPFTVRDRSAARLLPAIEVNVDSSLIERELIRTAKLKYFEHRHVVRENHIEAAELACCLHFQHFTPTMPTMRRMSMNAASPWGPWSCQPQPSPPPGQG